MKAYVVKAKAKLGKLPTKSTCKDLLNEDDIGRKFDIIKKLYPEISSSDSKIELEIGLENHLYDNLRSFLKFIKGEDRKLFEKYVSRYEILILEIISQAHINKTIEESLDIIKKDKFSKAFKIKKEYTFKDFVFNNKHTRYYRTLLPFLNENVDRQSLGFLVSNSLNK